MLPIQELAAFCSSDVEDARERPVGGALSRMFPVRSTSSAVPAVAQSTHVLMPADKGNASLSGPRDTRPPLRFGVFLRELVHALVR